MRVRILKKLLKRRWFLGLLGGVLLLSCFCCGSFMWFAAKPAGTPVTNQATPAAADDEATPAPTSGWPALGNPGAGWDLDFGPSTTVALTPSPGPEDAEGPPRTGRWIRVGWNGTGGANCHLLLDPANWDTKIVRIPMGTELEVLGETQTTVIWETEYTVWQVEYQGQKCYIRTQLAEELPLTRP